MTAYGSRIEVRNGKKPSDGFMAQRYSFLETMKKCCQPDQGVPFMATSVPA